MDRVARLADGLKKLAASKDSGNLKYYVTLGAASGATGALITEFLGSAALSKVPTSVKRTAVAALAGAIATPVAVRAAAPLLGRHAPEKARSKVEISRNN